MGGGRRGGGRGGRMGGVGRFCRRNRMGRGGRVYDMMLYMDRRLHWAGVCIFMVGEEYFLD